MLPFLENPTAHESFSLMLMERIEKLEEDNHSLKNEIRFMKDNIELFQKQHFFKFQINFRDKYSVHIDNYVKDYINDIMKHRIEFQPIFMIWNYTIVDLYDLNSDTIYDNNEIERYTVILTIFLMTENGISIDTMKQYIDNKEIKIDYLNGGLYELKTIVNEWMGYQVLLPYLNENNKIEIWTRGGVILDYETDPIMNTDTFTKSSNYLKSEALQEEYFRMVQMKHWNELLNIYHHY